MNPAWFFVIATVIAVLGILFAFKNMMSHVREKLEKGQEIRGESIQQEQTRFFIKVAMVEAIPILLIVYGFMQIEHIQEQNYNTLLPILIIICVVIFALIQILFLKRDMVGQHDPISTESNTLVNTLMMIGLAMVSAIPIVSIVAIFTMKG
jgi:MFS family permease